jgi:hypothetical protein
MKATSFFQKFEFNASDSVARFSSNLLEEINYVSSDVLYPSSDEIFYYLNSRGYYFGLVGGDAIEYVGFEDKRDYSSGKYVFSHTDYNLSHPVSFELKDSLKFNFHDLQFFQWSSYEYEPLKSRDPEKMENDEDSLIYDPILDMYTVQYYPGEQIIYKALADYDVYHQYLVNPEDLSHPVLKCVYFAVNNGKESATVMAIPMENPNYNEELAYLQAKLASFASPPRISWRESLLEEAEKGIKLDINKSKDKKLLKTQFYLDSVEGYSMNYFGISE